MKGAVVAMLFLMPFSAGAQVIDAHAGIYNQGNLVSWYGDANYYDVSGNRVDIRMTGNLTLFQEQSINGQACCGTAIQYDPWIVYNGSWSGDRSGYFNYYYCFAAAVVAQTDTKSNTVYSDHVCLGPPPCDPYTNPKCCDPAVNPSCPNDGGGGFEPINPGNPDNSPVVVNFGPGEYRLTGNESPVMFDINATGSPARIGWTAAGADEAFLCLDRNGNGTIDDGSELFGTATRLKDGRRAPNGFAALAETDANGDGFLDERDPIWTRLLLWRDLNHDGISQPSELMRVTASRLVAIRLAYHWTGRRDSSGNTFRYQAQVWIGTAARPLYDIFFVSVP